MIFRGIAATVFFFCLQAAPAWALDDDSQFWGQFITLGRPNPEKPLGLFFEYQIRHSQDQERLYESFIRPAVYYHLSDKLTVWLGYLSLRRWDFEEKEQRPWQQVMYADKHQGWAYLVRLRQEQRLFQNATSDGSDDDRVQNRTRLMLRVTAPAIGAEDRWYTFLPLVQNETFWNWNTWGSRAESGYNQNRLFLGISKWLTPQLQVDTGYLMVNLRQRDAEDANLNTFLITLWHRW